MKIVITWLPIIMSLGALFIAWKVYRIQSKAEKRQERAAALEVRPLVQAKPVRFDFHKETGFGDTYLEITNPSGYDAYDLTFDVKYDRNDWISEWLKANNQKREPLQKLEALAGYYMVFRGALPYPTDEICTRRKGFDVFVRARWRNERQRIFEVLGEYQLICTTVGGSHAFTFLLTKQSIEG